MQNRTLQQCNRCGYKWFTINAKTCAYCNSPNWNKSQDPPKEKDDEKWIFIKDEPYYMVSNYGRIFSTITSRIMVNRTLKAKINGKTRSIAVLMVSSFDPDNYYGQRIYYKNGEKNYIRMSNVDY